MKLYYEYHIIKYYIILENNNTTTITFCYIPNLDKI